MVTTNEAYRIFLPADAREVFQATEPADIYRQSAGGQPSSFCFLAQHCDCRHGSLRADLRTFLPRLESVLQRGGPDLRGVLYAVVVNSTICVAFAGCQPTSINKTP